MLRWLACASLALAPSCGSEDESQPGGPDEPALPTEPPPGLCITELMYHPVLEDSFEDQHEFIEIHNPTDAPVELEGWRFTRGIEFTFPAVTLPPAGYLVIAKNRTALLALTAYDLDPDLVVGDYTGQLDNGGETIELTGPRGGAPADVLRYDDGFPWAIAADGLGAGSNWLRDEWLPVEDHQYLGISLERVSCDVLTNLAANWVPSELDGATPGAENTARGTTPPAIVDSIAVRPAGGTAGAAIGSADPVQLDVGVSDPTQLDDLSVEYYVDDVSRTDEPVETVALDGAGPYRVELPAQADNSIVRFRVLGDRGSGLEVISPRPTDPYAWHAYFVTPDLGSSSRVYHLFIAPDDWTQLWDNIVDGRASDCEVVASWDEKVPAVLVHEGRVYDVRARYHGSRWNRDSGPDLARWEYPGPDRPRPPRALSWRFSFPRYSSFEGRDVVVLNKLTQGCPGLTASVGFELFRRVGLPAPATRYVRLQVNGGYYHYTLELERVDENLMRDYHELVAEQTRAASVEPLGHLFKSTGFHGDEGPWGWGDGRELEASCGFTAAQRYTYTYSRTTWEWAGHSDLISLIEGLHAARAQGTTALRAYLAAQFDVELALSYLAVINWSTPWDDMFQNYFLYQRRTDLKWMFVPWDLDRTFGDYQAADASLFVGEQGDRDNREGWWNYFKDSFFEAYRDEFVERMQQLNRTILSPGEVLALLDATLAAADVTEAEQAPAGVDCDFSEAAADFRDFVAARHDVVAGY